MAHQASASVLSWLPSHSIPAAKSFQLSPTQVPLLVSALNEDAVGLYYSAIISLLDAFNGIKSAYFSWSTVKLYYCCFYSVRCILACNRIGIFYLPLGPNKSAAFSIDAQISNSPHQEKSSVTHKIVWSIFEKQFPNNVILGNIGLDPANKWMTSLREKVNYKNPRFEDPVVPKHFYELDNFGMDGAINTYLDDTSFLYAFDADHAAVSFPIECIKRAKISLSNLGLNFDQIDHDHVDSCLTDIGLGHKIKSDLMF